MSVNPASRDGRVSSQENRGNVSSGSSSTGAASSSNARSRAESIDSVGDTSVLEKYADEYGDDDELDDDGKCQE
jgi:hypothetical protein